MWAFRQLTHRSAVKLILGTGLASAVLCGADPYLGTWKLNLEKSWYGTIPAPRSYTTMCVAEKGGAFKCTNDGVRAQGQPIHWEYTAKADGQDYPVTGSTFDAISIGEVDSHTRDYFQKKSRQAAGSFRLVVSKDGRTMIGTWSRKDQDGKLVSVMAVYDRQ